MFKKLLKYDLRSLLKVALVMTVIIFAVAVVGSISLRIGFETEYTSPVISSLSTLGGVFSIIGIILAVSVFGILVIYRFYKNLYSDEGYLTFTLPVSRKTILGEKIVFALICEAVCLVIIIFVVLIYMLISPVTSGVEIVNPSLIISLAKTFSLAFKSQGAWMILWILDWLIGLFAFSACAFMLAYFCITLGAIVAKKYKLLASIGIYYGVSLVLSGVMNVIFSIGLASIIAGVDRYFTPLGENAQKGVVALVIFGVIMAMAAFFIIFFNATLNKIENKLNLA